MSSHPGSDFLQRAEQARRQIREIDSDGLKALLADGAILIDVRDEAEFRAGHISGAWNVRGSILSEQAAEILPDPSRPVAVACAGGNRSAIAALELQTLGYTSVASLQGGLRHWPEVLVRTADPAR